MYSTFRIPKNDVLNLSTSASVNLYNPDICSGVAQKYITKSLPPLNPAVSKKPYTYEAELIPWTLGSVYTDITARKDTLRLNHWTILRDLILNPRTAGNGSADMKGKTMGMFIAVMPTDQPAQVGGRSYLADPHGNIFKLQYGDKLLPELPRLDAAQTQFVAK